MNAKAETDIEPTEAQPEQPEPISGLTLVKSEWNGDSGPEHHWFEIPAGDDAAKYQAEIDAFIAQRATISADDITVTAG